MMDTSLEDAIGLDAVIKLRNWLLASYPTDQAPTPLTNPSNGLIGPAVLAQWADADKRAAKRGEAPIGTLAASIREGMALRASGPRFYPEQYEDAKGRTWIRVMDRGTNKVARLPIRHGREYVPQDKFLTIDEAFHSVAKLKEAFNL